ncbi:hypothetical protein AV530_006428 [Patagioenas fasciata monilis]|uniref:Uncharacterized protein n=1 Tax=Patagioenas fasciata monilis TaxID=372326 RepID=A0A1V4KGE6_PATFA|nr:hypothetical protein AV530_006428 [Patagioenas fasciata monilis]
MRARRLPRRGAGRSGERESNDTSIFQICSALYLATRNPALGFYSFRDEGRREYSEGGKSVGEEKRGCVSSYP